MGDYASEKYLEAKKWVSKKITDGYSWDDVKTLCVSIDEAKNEFIQLRDDELILPEDMEFREWWYVFLSWQGSELKTYNALKNNKTDNINKLIETPGRGYRLMLYRAMIAEYAKYSALNKTSTKEFAAFTKLNNAKCVNVEPALTPGGEKGYAHRLFEELRESGGDENDTSRGNPQ